MGNIIAELEHEHREIRKAITLMSNLAREFESGNECEPALLDEIVQFMRIFGEQCHHAKEEKALFSLLATKVAPANGCPIAVLVGEHRRSHEFLNQLEAASARYKAGDWKVRSVLIDSLKSLVELYTQHIWKEECLLFPMANRVLAAVDYESLSRQFAAVESRIGFDVHNAMEAMINSVGQMQVCRENRPNSDSRVLGTRILKRTTMNILDSAAIRLTCKSCEQVYEVPLRDILLSHEVVHCGCPVPHETECPPVYQVRICGEETLGALQSAWKAVSRCAELAGGELVLLGSCDREPAAQPSIKVNRGEENVCSQCA